MKSLVALILCSAMISALPATPVDTDKDTYIPSAKQFDAAREKDVLINTVKHITHNPDQSYVGSFSAPDGAIRGITFDGTYIWAANSGDGNSTFGDKIWKVDAATGTVLGMYDGPGLGNPSGFAWDGAYLWHSDFGTDMIYKIDPVTATAVRSFPAPHGLIIDLAWDGQYLYGAAGSGDMIIKFDTISGAPLDTIYATCSSGNIAPYGLAYLPFNSGQVWTSDGNYGSNMVNEWNIAAASLIDQWAPDPAVYPCGLAYDPVSGYLWISCWTTDSIYIWDVGAAAGPAFWDFEDGWQGWTHTSGQPFPEGWGVKPSGLHAYYTPPDAGDSTMWIDSDAAGLVTITDTAYSPAVVASGLSLFKWGLGFMWYSGGNSEWVAVGVREFSSGAWQAPVELRRYQNAGFLPARDSVSVAAYQDADSLKVFFCYNDAYYDYYAAFDNVALYPALSHDVGSVAFLNPGPVIAPGAEDVVGVVANIGASSETYEVHCLVSDNTFAVVLDTTINVTTGVGEQDTLNFGTLTSVEGRTYDLTMATLLGTDVNPTNDTLEQSTYCTAVYWEVLTPMPVTCSGAYSGYAVINDTTYVHVFGGSPTASQTLHHVYNVVTGTWSAGTPLPMPMTYSGHCSIDNKIFLIGSSLAASNPFMVIYDAENDIYTFVALPTPVNDARTAVVDNSLIYIIGGSSPMGWSPSTVVQLYDVAGDSFFTGVTQLPGPIMGGVGGYLGNDTIIHTAGMQSFPEVYVNTTYLGYIDPSNPASITWSTGPDKPGFGTFRLNGASLIPPNDPGRLYVAGGHRPNGVFMDATYAYVSGSGWLTLPDKPVAHSNWGAAMVPLQDADGEYILYAAGGYNNNGYLDIFHALHTGIDPTGIFEQPGEAPTAFGFNLLTSNPVVDRVRFQFDMPYQGTVNFSVYDIAGRRVLDSDFSNISAGTHTVVWDRTDNQGREVANGIYFYRVEAAGNVATGKLILVR